MNRGGLAITDLKVLTLEVGLVLVLYEGVTTGFPSLLVNDDVHAADAAVLLEAVTEGPLICLVRL